MKIAAIIQARMGSTRLPGKSMMDISGKPMLYRVTERVRKSKTITDVIVATTRETSDDKISEYCDANGILCYRGSESDVLDRYYKAALEYKADVIVRITSDCPLIDPKVVDNVVQSYLDGKDLYSGACNVVKRTYPRGLDTEVFPFVVIESAWKNADEKAQREHVTKYIYDNPGNYKVLSVQNNEDYSRFRWTVDEESDLRLAREIYERLYKENNMFYLADVIKLLRAEPELIKINEDVKQKN